MSPRRTLLSARQAAAKLGFGSSNPILSAVRAGELKAEKLPGRTRNGRNSGAWQISEDALYAYADAKGIVVGAQEEPKNGSAAVPVEPTLIVPLSDGTEIEIPAPPTIERPTIQPAASEPRVTVALAFILELQSRLTRAESLLELYQPLVPDKPLSMSPGAVRQRQRRAQERVGGKRR